MEVRHLRSLLAVHEEGTFSRAALRLGYTQQAVSLHVRALERTVGQRLVDRGCDGSVLTDRGLQVAAAARRVLALVDGALHADPVPSTPRVRVGVFHPGGWLVLTAVVPVLRSRGRGVEVLPVTWAGQVDGLLTGTLDLVLTYAPLDVPGLREVPLWREDRIAWVRDGHPAVPHGTTDLRTVLDQPTWDMPQAPPAAREFWCAYAERGGAPRFLDEQGYSVEDVLLTAATTDAVGLAPASLSRVIALDGVRAVRVEGLGPATAVALVPHAPTPAALELLACLRSVLHALPVPDGVQVVAEPALSAPR